MALFGISHIFASIFLYMFQCFNVSMSFTKVEESRLYRKDVRPQGRSCKHLRPSRASLVPPPHGQHVGGQDQAAAGGQPPQVPEMRNLKT